MATNPLGETPFRDRRLEAPMAHQHPWELFNKDKGLQKIMDSVYLSIKLEQADVFGTNPDPRLIADDTAVKTLALSEYLRDFVKKKSDENVEIPLELEGQIDEIDDLTNGIIDNMKYPPVGWS